MPDPRLKLPSNASVPAVEVKLALPAPLPPPSSNRLPLVTMSEPVLLNATEYLATPVPADTVNVPALLIVPPLTSGSPRLRRRRWRRPGCSTPRFDLPRWPPLHVAVAWLFSTP